MGEDEWQFLHSMRNDCKGYCEEQVDRKWERTMERKNASEKALEAMRKKEEERKSTDTALVGSSYEEALVEATTETTAASADSISEEDKADDAYDPATEEVLSRRRNIVHHATDAEDKKSDREAMPQCYQICVYLLVKSSLNSTGVWTNSSVFSTAHTTRL